MKSVARRDDAVVAEIVTGRRVARRVAPGGACARDVERPGVPLPVNTLS